MLISTMVVMPTHREKKIVTASLIGQGRNRKCALQLKVTKHYVDQMASPLKVEYADLRVVDADDFPPGDYDVNYAGVTFPVMKRAGHYLARPK
jgi:hypothetical protein